MTDVLRIIVAPLAWLAAFSAVYGLHGLICGHGIEGPAVGAISLPRALMAGAYVLSIMALGLILWGLHTPPMASRSRFVGFVSRATGWTGLVATVWTLFPAVSTSYCQ